MAKKDIENDTVDSNEELNNGNNENVENSNENDSTELSEDDKYNLLNDKYLRLYSDFDNFRKRSIKEKADIISMASGDLMKDIITILDDFERAIGNNEKSDDIDSVKEGFHLIYNKFSGILLNKGLEIVNPVGDIFDAELHEAITNIPAPSEKEKGRVMDCVEKGYNLKGKPLRYPKVVVGQ